MTNKVFVCITNFNNESNVKVSILANKSPEPSELPMPPSNWLNKK